MGKKVLLSGLIAIVAIWACWASVASMEAQQDRSHRAPAQDISIRPIGAADSVLSLSSLKGKVVLLDFWATWCGPCRMSMPGVEALYKKEHARGFEVMGVALEDDDGSQIPEAVKSIGVTYPVGMATSKEDAQRYSTGSIPLMVLVDKKGMVCWMRTGYDPSGEEELTHRVSDLLAE